MKKIKVKKLKKISDFQNRMRENEIKAHYGMFGYRQLNRTISQIQRHAYEVYLKNENEDCLW